MSRRLWAIADSVQNLAVAGLTKLAGSSLLRNDAAREQVRRLVYHSTKTGITLGEGARRAFVAQRGEGAAVRAPGPTHGQSFDLTPTEDQADIVAAVTALADETIRPAAAAADTERAVPEPVWRAARELGLVDLAVPADLGGVAESRSAVTSVLVLEALARGDLGIATALLAPAAVAGALAAYGTADQQATYVPAFVGEKPVRYAAVALLEPQPLADPLRPMTTGRRRGGAIELSGVKSLVPGAEAAELLVVSASIEGATRLVLVEPGGTGFAVEDDPAMGLRAARTGRVVLDGVTVPESALLGEPANHLDLVRRSRLAWSAAACGVAQAVLDQVVPYVKEREAFGEPIAHRQAVAFMAANIAIELDAMRLVTWRAAALLDRGESDKAAAYIAQARSLVVRHGMTIGSDGVQLLGGHGFVKEFGNERWFRDLRGVGVMEGVFVA